MIESMERAHHPSLAGDDDIEVSAQKLMGVAILGALGSLALYYVYCSLGTETRRAIKDSISSTLKTNLQKLVQ